MHDMRRQDTANYLNMLTKEESVRFTWQAQQALIPIALNPSLGRISSFTKIIGRVITYARTDY